MQSHSAPYGSSIGARCAPEVLNTCLRKKACLYVVRKLALIYGYFSKQHLQAGFHIVAGGNIDSGRITRTKVNRCMQIILNSCFHFIIPRPDGMEENGAHFCRIFKKNVANDIHLLKSLTAPWNDLDISLANPPIRCMVWYPPSLWR